MWMNAGLFQNSLNLNLATMFHDVSAFFMFIHMFQLTCFLMGKDAIWSFSIHVNGNKQYMPTAFYILYTKLLLCTETETLKLQCTLIFLFFNVCLLFATHFSDCLSSVRVETPSAFWVSHMTGTHLCPGRWQDIHRHLLSRRQLIFIVFENRPHFPKTGALWSPA